MQTITSASLLETEHLAQSKSLIRRLPAGAESKGDGLELGSLAHESNTGEVSRYSGIARHLADNLISLGRWSIGDDNLTGACQTTDPSHEASNQLPGAKTLSGRELTRLSHSMTGDHRLSRVVAVHRPTIWADSTATHVRRTTKAIEGLHWHSGEVKYLSIFHESKLSAGQFLELSDGALPLHTYARDVQVHMGHISVVWQPQWVEMEDLDEDMVDSFMEHMERRLSFIPLPACDFWWRADTGEAILDYSLAYHLCSLIGCIVCEGG